MSLPPRPKYDDYEIQVRMILKNQQTIMSALQVLLINNKSLSSGSVAGELTYDIAKTRAYLE